MSKECVIESEIKRIGLQDILSLVYFSSSHFFETHQAAACELIKKSIEATEENSKWALKVTTSD